ncbi:S8 family serine peptidase [Myxococcus sp. K15C18031901]|uniref:S8 family serine peptidase n=1 Tax=Myxococcus dinghuensis TaxID=2906761 RepID=UPI0020A789DE|nr:S8 family serine peptidase [Myxococcus dinghuensis]MCP3102628.1 S8 family serine peptidase [Myxococcus dinghuensis]
MKRWGLMGLVALVSCMPDGPTTPEALEHICPGVTAGELPEATLAMSPPAARGEEGRERFIVRYRKDARVAASSRVQALGGRVTAAFRTVPAVAARLTSRERQALAADPTVEAIEPDEELRALGPATLPALAFAGAASRGTVQGEYTDGLRQVQANAVWDRDNDGVLDPGAPTGTGVKVCIIDSGIDPDHPELREAMVAGRDLLDGDDIPTDSGSERWGTGHGTHVAGIIGARPGHGGMGPPVLDERGVMGVAPGSELIVVRVLDLYGRTHMSLVMLALEYCQEQGAKVTSLSLGGGLGTPTTREAFKAALEHGMLVVAASGNDGGNLVSYPASDPSVLAVGAVDAQNRRAFFSSGGSSMGLVAPGVDVLSTFPRALGAFASLEVGETQPLSRSLLYGPKGDTTGALVDCGTGETLDSCGEGGSCDGFIAYVRPSPTPADHIMVNVMMQGARAVIFGNDTVESTVEILAVPQRGQWVPAVTISQPGSSLLGRMLGSTAKVSVNAADYAYMSGTSMSTPYVSGVAALLFSAVPTATPEEVKRAMLSTAKDLGPNGFDDGYGHGLVQARAALEALAGPRP